MPVDSDVLSSHHLDLDPLRLFTSSPEVLALFSKFQNLKTEEEMRASEAFQEHGEKVFNIKENLIDLIELFNDQISP